MNFANVFCSLLVSLAVCSVTNASGATSWAIESPNGQVKVSVQLAARGEGRSPLTYTVEHGGGAERSTLIHKSPLGLRLKGQDLRLRLDAVQPATTVHESYSLIHGKRSNCTNSARQLTVQLRNSAGLVIAVDMRAYNDGVAFRYRLSGGASGPLTVEAEQSGFALPADAKFWSAPSDKASTYSPAYETYYESEVTVGTASPLGFGWSFPMLYRTADSRHWGLITEAGVNSTFCGSRLSSNGSNGVYTVSFPRAGEGNGQGQVSPSSTLPWELPWRVIILGSSVADIVESTLVTDVCRASLVNDTSWIKPGRVAWSWWSDNPSPKDAVKQNAFVDLAAEMGWEYVLVDANWTIMENGNLHDVLKHAKEKGVGVLLWYNSGGPHNVVTEKPRDCFTFEPVRKFELELLKKWGVKGVKVDFFQSDKQDVMGLYEGIMRDAAAHQIMVNFHGCTLPRGWERTYPHLMSMEAVRGEECYIFDGQYPDRAPVQNTILPFTRNAVGPMDYTPVGLSDNRYPHKTTFGHELALSVLFESGWLHFTDSADTYKGLPDEPKQFLKEVPVSWDDTRFVDGYPGKFAVLARRKGNEWYLAGINGENAGRDLTIKPGKWLPAGDYVVRLISDAGTAREFKSEQKQLTAGEPFKVTLLPFGGFVAVLKQ